MTEGKGFNHHPTEVGIWFDYNGWRYKDYYHVELANGVIIPECYPNGDSWQPRLADVGYHIFDHDVVRVMLLPDHTLHEWAFKGTDRIKRNCEIFNIPPDIESFERHI